MKFNRLLIPVIAVWCYAPMVLADPEFKSATVQRAYSAEFDLAQCVSRMEYLKERANARVASEIEDTIDLLVETAMSLLEDTTDLLSDSTSTELLEERELIRQVVAEGAEMVNDFCWDSIDSWASIRWLLYTPSSDSDTRFSVSGELQGRIDALEGYVDSLETALKQRSN